MQHNTQSSDTGKGATAANPSNQREISGCEMLGAVQQCPLTLNGYTFWLKPCRVKQSDTKRTRHDDMAGIILKHKIVWWDAIVHAWLGGSWLRECWK